MIDIGVVSFVALLAVVVASWPEGAVRRPVSAAYLRVVAFFSGATTPLSLWVLVAILPAGNYPGRLLAAFSLVVVCVGCGALSASAVLRLKNARG